jgi:hypothetical protein
LVSGRTWHGWPFAASEISRQQMRDPETFLARLAVVAEGETEKGFTRCMLERALEGTLHDRGIWVTEWEGHDNAIDLLEALAEGGLQFSGFVDRALTTTGQCHKRDRAVQQINSSSRLAADLSAPTVSRPESQGHSCACRSPHRPPGPTSLRPQSCVCTQEVRAAVTRRGG